MDAFMDCERMKWASENPALALNAPTLTTKPTLPFTAAEMKKLLAACDRYPGNKERIKAFNLGDALLRASHRRHDHAEARPGIRDQLATAERMFLPDQKKWSVPFSICWSASTTKSGSGTAWPAGIGVSYFPVKK
jgi:hypothetical protein